MSFLYFRPVSCINFEGRYHENPTLAYLSYDSIKILLSYIAKSNHDFIYCVNKHFRAYKLSTYYYKLNQAKSLDFYFNSSGFRDNLLKAVANPSQQISLQFFTNTHVNDTTNLGNVHSLVLYACSRVRNLSPLRNIHHLNLTGTKNFTDVSPLVNVHTLILDDCSAKLNILGNLSSVRVFKLTKNKLISDLSTLVNCQQLYLSKCTNIKDVSMLSNLEYVKLDSTNWIDFNCSNNTKMSRYEMVNCPFNPEKDLEKKTFKNFTNMALLSIEGCNSIIKIKNLTKIYKIIVKKCSALRKIDMITGGNWNEIEIEGCSSLSAITNISNVFSLSIGNLNIMQAIDRINEVYRLSLLNLPILTNVENVTYVKHVSITSARLLSNFRFLIGNPLTNLELKDCSSLIDISYLGFCPVVTLDTCPGIADISSLVNCRRVVIKNCMGVTDVSSLGNVHDLYISYDNTQQQYHLNGVSSLGNVHTLALNFLDITDTDIATLGTVKNLTMFGCYNIVDVSPLVTVEKLRLGAMRNAKLSILSSMKDFIYL